MLMKNLFISINRRRNFLMQLIFAQPLFPNYIFSYLRQTYLTDTEIQRKIHFRERNPKFWPFELSQFDCPTRNQKYLVYYSPNNHSNTSNCIGVARTKSNSPQSARSGQSFVTTSAIFLVVAFGRLIYSASVRVSDRYNWSSVRVVNEIKAGGKKRTKIKRRDENKWTSERWKREGKEMEGGRKRKWKERVHKFREIGLAATSCSSSPVFTAV